jgi:predicted nucleic acid-binding protein
MTLLDELSHLDSIFIDTAPIIYYIEAHPQFGPLAKQVVDSFQSGKVLAYSSAITLTEVLVKPFETDNETLAKRFSEFLRYGSNITLMDLSADMAESAGRLRSRYPSLRTMDALQVAIALHVSTDAFITNDNNLKQIDELKVIVLKDYVLRP